MSDENGLIEAVPTTGVVIDRTRLSHGDTKRMALLEIKMQKAQSEHDVLALESLMEDADELASRIIVEVPSDWYVPGTPDELKCPAPGWINRLQQDKYKQLMQVSRAPEPGAEGN